MAHKNGTCRHHNEKEELDSHFQSIVIGGHYLIKRNNNEFANGEIIEARFNKTRKAYEYYVHYSNLNRRLDGWVTLNKIVRTQSSNDGTQGTVKDNKLITRNQKKLREETAFDDGQDIDSTADETSIERCNEELSKVRYTECVQFGIYEIDTWYSSPYPEEYVTQQKLFICEYCLKYMMLEKSYRFHLGDCNWRHPPGKEVYHKGSLSIYETDPEDNRLYCQNLCLFAKLFIDHKTAFYNVERFIFYILCEVDKHGSHIVGYFSKEKFSPDGYNVSCILTLPPFQQKGYGKLLIAFSYELSKLEGVIGTPERPLSDLGLLSYRSYWTWALLDILRDLRGTITIKQLSQMTSIAKTDIISVLDSMNMLKYWLGQENICLTPKFLYERILPTHYKRPRLTIDKSQILWQPRTIQVGRNRCKRRQEQNGRQLNQGNAKVVEEDEGKQLLDCLEENDGDGN